MENKFYELGIVCGRFGHEHNGHKFLFDMCISLCKTTLILLGSAQESKTLRNPFSVDTRAKVIQNTYPDLDENTLIIRGINDLTNEYDLTTDWGKYLKEHVKSIIDKPINLMVYGNDESRETWFTPEDIKNTARLIIPKGDISATLIRAYLVTNNKSLWKKSTPIAIHDMYELLRSELMEVPAYNEIYNKISKDVSLDNYMKVYKEMELQYKNSLK